MIGFLHELFIFIIIGDEKNEKFDGNAYYVVRNEYCIHHLPAIRNIYDKLKKKHYKLMEPLFLDIYTSATTLINNNHILFCNNGNKDYKYGMLFLPENATNKQLDELKKHEQELNQFNLYVFLKTNDGIIETTCNSNFCINNFYKSNQLKKIK